MQKHVGQIVQPLRKTIVLNVRLRFTECSPFLALWASSWQPWFSRQYLQPASGVALSWDVLLVSKGELDINYLCIFLALGVSPSLDPIYLGLWSYCPLLTAAGCNHTYLYSSEHDIKTQMLQPCSWISNPRCCYHALPRLSALPFLLAAVVTTVGAQAALAHLFRRALCF